MLENTVLDLRIRAHKLGNALHTSKKVPVLHLGITWEIPVKVWKYRGSGHYQYVNSKSIRSYEALGLLPVRSTNERSY